MPPWLLWTFVALFSWGIWAVLSKWLADALSAEQSQALSTLGMLPILVQLSLSKRASLRGASRYGLVMALLGEKTGTREVIGIACALVSVAALSFETRHPNSPILNRPSKISE